MKNIKLFEEFVNEKIVLTPKGEDNFRRTVYRGDNGKKYVDVDGVPHTMSRDGEPDSPLAAEYEIKGAPVNQAAKHNYMMLSRLQQDCDYFLGNGNRSEKHLWAGNVDAQIKEMKRLWNMLQEKPEWLSMEDILDYEKRMKQLKEFFNDPDFDRDVAPPSFEPKKRNLERLKYWAFQEVTDHFLDPVKYEIKTWYHKLGLRYKNVPITEIYAFMDGPEPKWFVKLQDETINTNIILDPIVSPVGNFFSCENIKITSLKNPPSDSKLLWNKK